MSERQYTSFNALLAIVAVLACVTFTEHATAPSSANFQNYAQIAERQRSSLPIIRFAIFEICDEQVDHKFEKVLSISPTKPAELLHRARKVWRLAITDSTARLEQIPRISSARSFQLRANTSLLLSKGRIRAPPE